MIYFYWTVVETTYTYRFVSFLSQYKTFMYFSVYGKFNVNTVLIKLINTFRSVCTSRLKMESILIKKDNKNAKHNADSCVHFTGSVILVLQPRFTVFWIIYYRHVYHILSWYGVFLNYVTEPFPRYTLPLKKNKSWLTSKRDLYTWSCNLLLHLYRIFQKIIS